MKGLIIKEPWIDLILKGEKTWEIRSSHTKIRGEIYLIKSGTGHIFGKVNVVDSIKLTPDTYFNSVDKHKIENHQNKMPYKNTHAWVLEDPVLFKEPIPYKHPQGAVIWVNM